MVINFGVTFKSPRNNEISSALGDKKLWCIRQRNISETSIFLLFNEFGANFSGCYFPQKLLLLNNFATFDLIFGLALIRDAVGGPGPSVWFMLGQNWSNVWFYGKIFFGTFRGGKTP